MFHFLNCFSVDNWTLCYHKNQKPIIWIVLYRHFSEKQLLILFSCDQTAPWKEQVFQVSLYTVSFSTQPQLFIGPPNTFLWNLPQHIKNLDTNFCVCSSWSDLCCFYRARCELGGSLLFSFSWRGEAGILLRNKNIHNIKLCTFILFY